MTTETKIAEENIEWFIKNKTMLSKRSCEEHKASCQRFLEKLEKKIFLLKQIDSLILWHKNRSLDVPYDWDDYEGARLRDLKCSIGDEITDLKNAIKKYEEVGI